MARIMALDYGTVRTGIAVTDELQLIASGLKTVATNELMTFLKAYLQEEPLELLVIGKPKQMNNTDSQSELAIQKFIESLNETFPGLAIERIDERFTSKMAFQSMIDSGIKKKKRREKGLIDTISATLILQNYLAQKP
ncbi:Holliday junction resolvase RuvX [Winogradskyella aurantiaca]|uniref:Holliday junction resolvase RuvX n=1 Tax=Winogradskyella aurantiaca TaxID=2219558 RepID=UPI000E1CC7FD|nr:Holliday junction resolvase RuvX [Winogradskyella aurantiaca]